MIQSLKNVFAFLALSLILTYPQEAIAGKNNFFNSLKKAVIEGDSVAARRVLGGDIGRAVAAAHGDEAAKAKLKRDWESAKEKVNTLTQRLKTFIKDEEETLSPTPASSTAAAGSSTTAIAEDITPESLSALTARMAVLEARLNELLEARGPTSRLAASSLAHGIPATANRSATHASDNADKRADLEAIMAQVATEESLQTASATHPATGTEDPENPAAVISASSALGRATAPINPDDSTT